MRLFALKNAFEAQSDVLAVLTCYDKPREYWIDLPENADPWTVPLLLSSFARRGTWEIEPEWAERWVSSRIVPESRQNLGEILRENGLESYDSLRLIELTEGKNSQDDCFLEALRPQDAPAWFRLREEKRLAEAVALDGTRLLAAFLDGTLITCEVASLVKEDRRFARVIRDETVFGRLAVGPGGRCVQWGSQLRLSAATLREAGVSMPLSWDELSLAVPKILLDANEAAHLLNCSRQNINSLVKRGALEPVKTSPKSTLFLRASIRARLG